MSPGSPQQTRSQDESGHRTQLTLSLTRRLTVRNNRTAITEKGRPAASVHSPATGMHPSRGTQNLQAPGRGPGTAGVPGGGPGQLAGRKAGLPVPPPPPSARAGLRHHHHGCCSIVLGLPEAATRGLLTPSRPRGAQGRKRCLLQTELASSEHECAGGGARVAHPLEGRM